MLASVVRESRMGRARWSAVGLGVLAGAWAAGCGDEPGTRAAPGGVFVADDAGAADASGDVGVSSCTVLVRDCGERCCGQGLRCVPTASEGNACRAEPAEGLAVGTSCDRTIDVSCVSPGLCIELDGARATCRAICDLEREDGCNADETCQGLRIAGDERAGFCAPREEDGAAGP